LEKKIEKISREIDNNSIDEMRTYVKKNNEENLVWIWIACIEKDKDRYYAYEVGDRSKKTF